MKLNVSVIALLAAVTLSVVSGCSNSSPAKMQPASNMMGMQSEKMDNSMSSKSEGTMAGDMQPKMDGKMTPEMKPKMDPKMTAPVAETPTQK